MADLDDVVYRLKEIEKEIERVRSDISELKAEFGYRPSSFAQRLLRALER
jgi:hypothetical protein